MVAGPLFVPLSEPNNALKDHTSPRVLHEQFWIFCWPYVSPRET